MKLKARVNFIFFSTRNSWMWKEKGILTWNKKPLTIFCKHFFPASMSTTLFTIVKLFSQPSIKSCYRIRPVYLHSVTKMKKILLQSLISTLLLLICSTLFAQKLNGWFNNSTLSLRQHLKTQQYYSAIQFITPNQIRIKSGLQKSDVSQLETDVFEPYFMETEEELILKSHIVKLSVNKITQEFTLVRLPHEVLWKGRFSEGEHPETNKQILELVSDINIEEHFYGLGERLNGFDQKGKRVTMQLSDAWSRSNELAYKAVPFYMSSRNYGFLVSTAERVIFDIGNERTNEAKIIMPGQSAEFVIFASNSPLKVIEQYTDITGKSPIIPTWSLEPWLSRRGHAGWTNTKYCKQEMDQLEEHGYRFGVVLWEGLRRQFEKEQEPSVYSLVNYWHNKGMKAIFWDRTGQLQETPENKLKYKYDEEPVKSYFICDKNNDLVRVGSKGGTVNPDSGKSAFIYIDPTNPEAMEWWFENIYAQKILSDNGESGPNGYNLDGIKIDFAELFPSYLKDYKTHIPTPGIANVHAVKFAEAVNDWLTEVKPDGGITWGRGGGIGIQRGGIFWNGDRMRNFAQLKGTVSSLLSVSVSGLAYAGHDVGGYMKGDDPEAAETYIRGVQFATFSPFFHDHGSVQAPREQNEYGRENYAFYTRVRYNLIPYLNGLINDANKLGWPMMRPLFFYHPNDKKAWNVDDEYYLGKDLLVAPILTKGTSRLVYLPAGRWVDFWTDEEFYGNTEILINKDLNRIPVFIRKDAIFPLALNENLEEGGMFPHSNKNKLRITYKFACLNSGTFILPTVISDNIVLTTSKTNNTVQLNFEGVSENFALKIPNTIPTSIKINGETIVADAGNFKSNKQGWKYDTESSELKIKVEAQKGIEDYSLELVGLSDNKVPLLKGKTIADIPRPQLPKIISIEPWNESVDIVFDKEDKLGERYIIGYGLDESLTADNRYHLNFGNKVTIKGLQNNRRYYFRVWAENQFFRSIETDWYTVVPKDDKRPVNTYTGKGMFIQANHFSAKEVTDDGTKKYRFDLESTRAEMVKVWIQLNQHRTHHDYDKWYEIRGKQLQKSDSIRIEVPSVHTLTRVFIAPEGETPFFNDDF